MAAPFGAWKMMYGSKLWAASEQKGGSVGELPTLAAAVVGPFMAYAAANSAGFVDVSAVCYALLVAILSFSSLMLWAKLFTVFRRLRRRSTTKIVEMYPSASAIVAGHLPADTDALIATAEAFLAVEYPGEFEVILAFSTDGNVALEAEESRIADVARRMPERFKLFRMVDAGSQEACEAAARRLAVGGIVGIFVPGQLPARECMVEAVGLASTEGSSALDVELELVAEDCPLLKAVLRRVAAVFGEDAKDSGSLRWCDFAELTSAELRWQRKVEICYSLLWAKVLPVALLQIVPLLLFLVFRENGGGRLSSEQTLRLGTGLLMSVY